ncbi:hypothetical protein [Pseudomonas aeruginosa]|nr:hypothetical protein [Pseudomonas aeruginosa]MCS8361489.1 hypothetical protein [Pseudomonas aeruginosa]MCS8644911.1 hypothetical protein [Pseudomonas aeruginosa]MDV7894778.1 hypothetical protein [Pseudomonas aeruginosa]PRW31429.1 hypothetical protein CSB96_4684 [Pseudomonas aeruginosa]
MTKCTFCNKTREWAKKWARVAVERAASIMASNPKRPEVRDD